MLSGVVRWGPVLGRGLVLCLFRLIGVFPYFLPSWVMVKFVLLLTIQGPAVASIPDHYPYRGVSGLCGWIVDLSFVMGVWEADPVRAG